MTQTLNTVPSAGASFLATLVAFLEQEDAERGAHSDFGFVVSGGTHATGAGLTKTPDALTAYAGGFYLTEAGSILYTASITQWVIADKDTTGNLSTFTRVTGTHYLLDTTSGGTQPALPAGAIWLMKVVCDGSGVTTVTDLRTMMPTLYVGSTTTDFPTGRKGMWALASDSGFYYIHNGTSWARPTIITLGDPAHTHQSAAQGGTIDHGLAVTGLADDDHTQYTLLAGRSGGQTIIGGTASGNDLTLSSTSHATKGAVIVGDAQIRLGASTPTQITGDQNNYDPGDAGILRLSTDATRTITGISGGAAGRVLYIVNEGTTVIRFAINSGSSSAANRMIHPDSANFKPASSYDLLAGRIIQLIYDGTDSLWTIVDLHPPQRIAHFVTAANYAKTNDTFVDVTEFLATMTAGVYQIELNLVFTAVNTTMDVKAGWTTASTVYWGAGLHWASVATASSPTALLGAGDSLTAGSINGTFAIKVHGIVVCAGLDTLQFKFAQNTTDAGALTLLEGSSMSIVRMGD